MRHQNYATHTILGKTDIKLGIIRTTNFAVFFFKLCKTRFIVKYPNIPY